MTQVAALAFTALLGALTVFQIALVAGAPLGEFAWGGADRVLPGRKRIGSVIAVVLYAGFALLALLRAGLVGDAAHEVVVVIAMWVVFAYSALGIAINAISRSPRERYVMTPLALLLAILSFIVAIGS